MSRTTSQVLCTLEVILYNWLVVCLLFFVKKEEIFPLLATYAARMLSFIISIGNKNKTQKIFLYKEICSGLRDL